MKSGTFSSLTVRTEHLIESFDLATASEMTGLHREFIVELTRSHLVRMAPPSPSPEEPLFDEHGLCRLRQIANLRENQKVNFRTVRLIVRLLDRLEEAEEELRFLREQVSLHRQPEA